MPAAQVSIDASANADQVILETQNALDMTVPGNDKPPVEHIRDGTGRPTAVIIHFPDAVTQSERAAALTKISRNNGVAAVYGTPIISFQENFDSYSACVLEDQYPNASWIARYTFDNFLRLQTNGYYTGNPTPTNEIDGVNAGSAPNSLKQKVVVPGGSSSFFQFAIGYNQLPARDAQLSELTLRCNFRHPATAYQLGPANVANKIMHLIGLSYPISGKFFQIYSGATPDPVTPPTQLVGISMNPTPDSGNPANFVLPIDGAFHPVELAFAATATGVTLALSVDGAVVDTYIWAGKTLTGPFYFSANEYGFGAIGGNRFDGPFTAERNVDDLFVSYKLL